MARRGPGVLVQTSEYEFSHGHAPRGRGGWAFRFGSPEAEPTWIHGSLTYAEARAAAVRMAREHGVATIFVCS